MATLADRILLLLAIKEEGKHVGIDHIFDKVKRDIFFVDKRIVTRQEVEETIGGLVNQGLLVGFQDGFALSEGGSKVADEIILGKTKELNHSYVTVWMAKKYYPKAGEPMLPFLKGRAVSTVKVFSGKDPIRDLATIFVRYARYKPRPVLLTVDSKERLMELVFDHCVDFIPYIHKLGAKEPDVFVLDLDAGARLLGSPRAFDLIKYVTVELSRLLMELEVEPMVKFSGARGFQVWAHLDNAQFSGKGDVFKLYRDMAVEVQRRLEERLQKKMDEVHNLFYDLIIRGRQITTSVVAHKEERAEQILIDWSVLKPMGDVRAPFSLHYKTGLVSLPLALDDIPRFTAKNASPLKVLEDFSRYEKAAKIRECNPLKLLPKA